MKNGVVLYPGSWLYNAGVVGFLRVVHRAGYSVENFLNQSGEVTLPNPQDLLSQRLYVNGLCISSLSLAFFQESAGVVFSEKRKAEIDLNDPATVIQEVWGTLFNVYYRGFFNADSRLIFSGSKSKPEPLLARFDKFLQVALLGASSSNSERLRCSFCGETDGGFTHKNRFSMEHSSFLGASPSGRGMPNAFWNCDRAGGLQVCDRCSFMMLCSHLAFIPTSGGERIFLNAPSFQVMWYLNRLFREIYARGEVSSFREIAGLSLIELALRLQTQLGIWTKMNIEVVVRRRTRDGNKETIDFYVLPYEVVRLLLDQRIACLLSEIGEMSILRMVLEKRFKEILEVGERLLRIALKGSVNKNQDREYLEDYVRSESKRGNLMKFASDLFSLYSLIEEGTGGGVW